MEDLLMQKLVTLSLALTAAIAAVSAQEPAKQGGKPEKKLTPAAQYRAITNQYQKALQKGKADYTKASRLAKTNEEKRKLREEKLPKPAEYSERLLTLAREHPKDPAAVDALAWIAQHDGHPLFAATAVEIVGAEHIKSPKLGPICQGLGVSPAPAAEELLRAILEKNPDRSVQAMACMTLAERLKGQASEEPVSEEAEKLYERVIKKYGDVKWKRGTMGSVAKRELHRIRHFGIGKTAPEIEGLDLNGQRMRLSDYRGKVVVLDFWGNW
jgi:hypothetical protein